MLNKLLILKVVKNITPQKPAQASLILLYLLDGRYTEISHWAYAHHDGKTIWNKRVHKNRKRPMRKLQSNIFGGRA